MSPFATASAGPHEPEEGVADARKQGVAAVERALSILDAFRDDEPHLGLTTLAERTGLYKSTILRLISSLESHGYIRRLDGGEYQLGPAVFRLGMLYRQSFRLEDFVVPCIRDLSLETNESTSFYIRDGEARLCLFRVDSKQLVRDYVRAGDRLPLDRGAGGHVLTGFAAGARSGHRFVIATTGERQADTAAVAAPVFGQGGELLGAMSVSGPRTRFTKPNVLRIAVKLLERAKQLTRMLGGDASIYPLQPDL